MVKAVRGLCGRLWETGEGKRHLEEGTHCTEPWNTERAAEQLLFTCVQQCGTIFTLCYFISTIVLQTMIYYTHFTDGSVETQGN